MNNLESKSNCILLRSRKDRLGSNFIFNLGIFIFAKINNLKLYGDLEHKYRNSILFINFFESVKFRSHEKYLKDNKSKFIKFLDANEFIEKYGFENNLMFIMSGMRGPILNSLYFCKQDLISYFNQNYKNNFLIKIKNKLSKFKLPWHDNKNIICFHIRLDDQSNTYIQTFNLASNYIRKLIDKDEMYKYNYRKKDKQTTIHYKIFENQIIKLKNKYPEKEIYIIKKGEFKKKYHNCYENIIKKYNLIISPSENEEEDIWKMMNSEILVLSKSTFPYISGFYHLGSTIYYEKWSVSSCLGLGTKYDNSNWIGFPDSNTLNEIGYIRDE